MGVIQKIIQFLIDKKQPDSCICQWRQPFILLLSVTMSGVSADGHLEQRRNVPTHLEYSYWVKIQITRFKIVDDLDNERETEENMIFIFRRLFTNVLTPDKWCPHQAGAHLIFQSQCLKVVSTFLLVPAEGRREKSPFCLCLARLIRRNVGW